MSRPNTSTIPNILEAEGFSALQFLMLRNNQKIGAYFPYRVVSPQYEGDTWKAIYDLDIMKYPVLKKAANGSTTEKV